MNQADINKLRDIDQHRLSKVSRYYAENGPYETKEKNEIKERTFIWLLIAVPFALFFYPSDPTIPKILVALITGALFGGLGMSVIYGICEFMYDLGWFYLVLPSYRKRRDELSEQKNAIDSDISTYVREIEGDDGLLWRFTDCFNHYDSSLDREKLEDLISSSMGNEKINTDHYCLIISELNKYYRRASIRESYKAALKQSGPCINQADAA